MVILQITMFTSCQTRLKNRLINMTILLILTLSCYFPVNLLPEIYFQNSMLQQVNSSGQLPTCNLHQFADKVDQHQCRAQCEQNNQCVYFMFKNMCGSLIGCLLCIYGNYVGSGVLMPRDMVANVDYAHVKLGVCQHYGVCPPARDCSELMSKGYITSGVYPIRLDNGTKVSVYCDMDTQGGGWTVFQRRMDGSEDFYRTWGEYEAGFGNLNKEFWLGNSHIAALTSQTPQTMRVELSDFNWTFVYGLYEDFMVDSTDSYRMTYKSFKGNTGEDLKEEANNSRFSTKDRDLDGYHLHCSEIFKGGWWYGSCHHANLNGLYLNGSHTELGIGVNWHSFRGYYYSLRFTEMKIRPKDFIPPINIYPFQYGSLSPRDCSEYRDQGFTQSGIYPITTRGRKQTTFKVYCDMETSGGGWSVFQKRFDGSVDFYQNYSTYQKGFGSLDREFWLGNDPISYITEQGPYELRVDLEAFDGVKKYALYDSFSISRDEDYRLWLGKYTGNAGDSLTVKHKNKKWTTFDRDNDVVSIANCAQVYHGGWWYSDCHSANLNGLYGSTVYGKGLNWVTFRGVFQSMKTTEMKIRPAGYQLPV